MKITTSKRQKTVSKKYIKGVPSHIVKQKKKLVRKQIRGNRPLHKRIMLHPFSVFLVLCMLVFVSDWTFRVAADSYTITAQILAPALTEGAIITSLTNNETVTSAPITISGICPDNSYVNLYINNLFNGADYCTNQVFTIQTQLYPGLNNITAKDFNVTNGQGPSTPGFNVTLTPQVPIISGPNIVPSQTPVPALVLESTYYYQTFTTNNNFSWQLNLSGGKTPYSVTIKWGDGKTSNLVFKTDPAFSINHRYTKPGSYTVIVDAQDADKNQRIIQLTALIKVPGSPSLATTISKSTPQSITYSVNNFFISSKLWLWAAWSSMIVVILMLISFVLGEREQRVTLLRRQLLKSMR
jgi:hypothetical protein